MKRVIVFVGAVSALGALVPNIAHAQERGFAVPRFEPSERGSEWFAADSLDLRGRVRPIIGVVGDYANRPLVIYDGSDEPRTKVIDHQLLAHVGAGVILFDRLRLAASMPISFVNNGQTGNVGSAIVGGPKNEVGVGDLRFGADVRLFGQYGGVATGAIGAQVWVPTGDEANYLGDGKVRFAPHFTVAGDVGPFVYSAKPGFMIRPRDDSFAGVPLGHEITLALAAGVRLGKRTVIGPEVFMSSATDDFFAKRTTPVEGLIGIHHTMKGGLRLGAGAGLGLARGLGTPQARVLLNIEWMPEIEEAKDSDGDGILDGEDACPEVAGVASTDRSRNGCPPSDRDRDGILDNEDACPDVPGVKTSDPSTNGCPADRDKDGILDSDDACPDVAGVKTNDPKTNGCPADSDGDGILDKDDACPSQPGPKDADPKKNGCPDDDRDKDGISNTWDACPDEPGPKDPDPKKNGCPKAFVKAGKIQIIDQVRFKTGSAAIDPGKDSEDVLKAVQKVLTDHPEIKKVRVEGHTDNRGAAGLNKKLSADRAASVVKWLTSHGVAADRLSSAGFGQDKPIASNETEEGRLTNRRVEFHIEEK